MAKGLSQPRVRVLKDKSGKPIALSFGQAFPDEETEKRTRVAARATIHPSDVGALSHGKPDALQFGQITDEGQILAQFKFSQSFGIRGGTYPASVVTDEIGQREYCVDLGKQNAAEK